VGVRAATLDPQTWSMYPPPIAPNILGYAFEVDGETWIPLIIANPPGAGHVGRFLDSLLAKPDRTFVFIEVSSTRLAEMLERRGWHFGHRIVDGDYGEEVISVMEIRTAQAT